VGVACMDGGGHLAVVLRVWGNWRGRGWLRGLRSKLVQVSQFYRTLDEA